MAGSCRLPATSHVQPGAESAAGAFSDGFLPQQSIQTRLHVVCLAIYCNECAPVLIAALGNLANCLGSRLSVEAATLEAGACAGGYARTYFWYIGDTCFAPGRVCVMSLTPRGKKMTETDKRVRLTQRRKVTHLPRAPIGEDTSGN